eukprot:m.224436 g.224436  ORF g.224436 m.224436 type:complete len:482 (-) comp16465_c0_seq1:1487-2932(-)
MDHTDSHVREEKRERREKEERGESKLIGGLLAEGDLVAEAESDALGLAADADVPANLAIGGAFEADVGQRVLTEHTPRVQVGCKEVALALQGRVGGQATHVGGLEQMVKVRLERCNAGAHRNLVLPLKLHPHRSKVTLRTVRRCDVVHDVNVDIVEHDDVAVGRRARHIVHNVAKDDPRLRRRHLDVGLDGAEVVGADGVCRGLFCQLEVAQRGKLQCQVLQRVRRLVDDKHIEQNVVLVDMHVSLGVDGVREAAQLEHLAELGRCVPRLACARGLPQIELKLILQHLLLLTLEGAEGDQVIGLDGHHILLGLCLGALLQVRHRRKHGLERALAVAQKDLGQRGCRVRQHPQAKHDSVVGVVIDGGAGQPALAGVHNRRHDEHGLGTYRVLLLCIGLGQGLEAQRHLGQRRGQRGPHKEVAVQQQLAQGRLLGRGKWGRGNVGALCGIRAVGGDAGLGHDLGGQPVRRCCLGCRCRIGRRA